MKYKRPGRLCASDTVAIVSPSWGGPSLFPHVYECRSSSRQSASGSSAPDQSMAARACCRTAPVPASAHRVPRTGRSSATDGPPAHAIQVEAVKQRLLRHHSLTHHRPALRMLAMSESVDRRHFKAEFFNRIRRIADRCMRHALTSGGQRPV